MDSIFGGSEKKPLCQCPSTKDEKPCAKEAVVGKLFCKQHMSCEAAPTNGSEPKYIPQVLNKSKAYLETNNCLSYALRGNKLNMELIKQCKDTSGCNVNFEQPGAASGKRKAMRDETLRTCPVVEKLTKADLAHDFKDSTFYKKCPKGYSKVALVVDKGTDYHWYRQNPDSTWSNKDGSNPVKNFDAEKRKIFNPKQASRNYGSDLNYEDFCGFFCVNRRKTVNLKQGGKRKKSTRKPTNNAQRKTRKSKSNKNKNKNKKK